MVEMNLFHYQNRDSWLHRRHPLAKLLMVLVCSPVLAVSTLPGSTMLLVLVLAVAWSVHLPLVRYLRELRFFVGMALVMAVARVSSGMAISDVWASTAAFIAMVVLGAVFVDSTSSDDLSCSLGPVLSKIPRLPGYRIAATMELALLSIPLVIDTVHQVSVARTARMERAWRHPVKRMVSFGTNTLELLLEQVQTRSSALDARLFSPDLPRHFGACSVLDIVLIICALGCSLLILGLGWYFP